MSLRRKHRAARLALVALVLGAASAAQSAQTVHLTVTAAGTTLLCESTQTSMGREDTIEAFSFGANVFRPLDPATGLPGNDVHRPLRITKRIDRCSPQLMRALVNGEPIAATIRFFRPNPSGDGTTQQFYTITIANALVVGISTLSPDTLSPANLSLPPLETVSFVYGQITWTHTDGGVTFGPVVP